MKKIFKSTGEFLWCTIFLIVLGGLVYKSVPFVSYISWILACFLGCARLIEAQFLTSKNIWTIILFIVIGGLVYKSVPIVSYIFWILACSVAIYAWIRKRSGCL